LFLRVEGRKSVEISVKKNEMLKKGAERKRGVILGKRKMCMFGKRGL